MAEIDTEAFLPDLYAPISTNFCFDPGLMH